MELAAGAAPVRVPARDECVYTSCYCEENVHFLCQQGVGISDAETQDAFAVFISNPPRTCPVFQQKSGRPGDGLVVWDYHVIYVVASKASDALVFDLDTRLDFPCSLQQYVEAALSPPNMRIPDKLRQMVRVVSARHFLETFASDRSHMIGDNGKYQSAPPSYAPIGAPGNNLDKFWTTAGSECPSMGGEKEWRHAVKGAIDGGMPYGMCMTVPEFSDYFAVG